MRINEKSLKIGLFIFIYFQLHSKILIFSPPFPIYQKDNFKCYNVHGDQMKKGITFIEVIIGMVIIATSITVLLTMMQVYNSSYNSTKSYNDSMNEIIRVKEVIDQFMERNRNKQFKYNSKLYLNFYAKV